MIPVSAKLLQGSVSLRVAMRQVISKCVCVCVCETCIHASVTTPFVQASVLLNFLTLSFKPHALQDIQLSQSWHQGIASHDTKITYLLRGL